MRALIPLLLSAALLSSCSNTTSPPAGTADGTPISGTYRPGSNLTEPRPASSRFLRTVEGGFATVAGSAAYYLRVSPQAGLPPGAYLRITYPNPQQPDRPYVNDMTFDPSRREMIFSSPGIVPGLRNYQTYTVTVTVHANRAAADAGTPPIDVLKQPIRAYVDTTGPQVQVFRGLRAKP